MKAKTVRGKVSVAFPSGMLYAETGEALRSLLRRVVNAPTPAAVVSFSEAKSLSSDGIRALVLARDEAEENGKKLYITDLSKEIKYVLRVTNLLDLFVHVPTLTETLACFGADKNDLLDLIDRRLTSVGTEPSPEKSVYAALVEEAATQKPATPEVTGRRATLVNRTILKPEDMRAVIKNHAPGKLCLVIVANAIAMHADVFSIDEIEARLDHKYRGDVMRKELKRLVARGTLTALGGKMYNLGISAVVRDQIEQVVAAYHRPDTHDTIINLLHDVETSANRNRSTHRP